MEPRKPRAGRLKPLLVRNRRLASFRNNATGKIVSRRCSQLNILDRWYAIGWKGGQVFEGAGKRPIIRRFTEWFDRRYWTLVTPEERKRHYIAKETARVKKDTEQYERRVAKRLAREATGKVPMSEEKKAHMREYMRAWRERGKAKKASILPDAPPRILPEAPEVVIPLEHQAAPNVSPDELTPAEEALLTDNQPKARTSGDINKELPNEYNARFHMEHDKLPFGPKEKLQVFDALVTSEATMQDARRRLSQGMAKRTIHEKIEREGSGWTSG